MTPSDQNPAGSPSSSVGTFPRFLQGNVAIDEPTYENFLAGARRLLDERGIALADRLFALFLWHQALVAATSAQQELPPVEASLEAAQRVPPQQEGLKAGLLRGIFLGFLETAGQGSLSAPILYTVKAGLGFGSVGVGTFGSGLGVSRLLQTPLPGDPEAYAEELSTLARELIDGGLFLTFANVFQGLCLLLMSLPVAGFYCRAAACCTPEGDPNQVQKRGLELARKRLQKDSAAIHHLYASGAFCALFESLMVRQPVVHSLLHLD